MLEWLRQLFCKHRRVTIHPTSIAVRSAPDFVRVRVCVCCLDCHKVWHAEQVEISCPQAWDGGPERVDTCWGSVYVGGESGE